LNQPLRNGLIIGCAVVLMFVVNLLSLPTWGSRTITMAILAGCGSLLSPPLSLIPGIFGISADILGLEGIEQSFTAGGFLFWACLILVPYGLATALERLESATGDDGTDDVRESEVPSPSSRSSSSSGGGRVTGAVDTSDEEAFERLQWLMTRRLELARSAHGFNLLLVYDVEQKEANLSYALDPEDVVNREVTFRPDTGQGIGWVLRHREPLEQSRENIDWRNLQYRTRPGDLERVKMVPLFQADQMVGILVVEWRSEPEDTELSEFVEELEHLMALRREIHQLRQNQDAVEMMETLHDLNPLEENRFDSMIHRSLEIVSTFIPAEEGHVEFFSYSEDVGSDDVIHQGRRAVYEECMSWIKDSDDVLRISDLSNHRLGRESLSRFGQVEVRSFLGGAVEKDGELVGMICLDHPQPDYFTRQDAELLKSLLDHLSQVLRIGQRLDAMDKKQAEYRRLLDVFQVSDTERDLPTFIEQQVARFREHLPVISVGYFENTGGEARMVAYDGEGDPSREFDRDHALVRRINNAESYSTMLSFPDLSRFEGYEAPLNAEGLNVIPVGLDTRIEGFFTLFVNDADKLDDVLFEELERILPLLLAPVRLMIEREQLEEDNRRDSITDLPGFEAWKSELSSRVDEDTERIAVWYVRVPGFEEIAEERGRDRARNWLNSVAKLLGEHVENSVMTRSYAGTFMGFETGDAERIEDQMDTVVERISDWSFPTGQWPRSPQAGYIKYSAPFPAVRKMVDGPFKKGSVESTGADE
jgi:hypothetical protein